MLWVNGCLLICITLIKCVLDLSVLMIVSDVGPPNQKTKSPIGLCWTNRNIWVWVRTSARKHDWPLVANHHWWYSFVITLLTISILRGPRISRHTSRLATDNWRGLHSTALVLWWSSTSKGDYTDALSLSDICLYYRLCNARNAVGVKFSTKF